MSSDKTFVAYVVEQIQITGVVTSRKLFGEYAIYCNSQIVALVCDNQVFVKPTAHGKKFIGEIIEGTPYPKAKPHFVIDNFENSQWFSQLILITYNELISTKMNKKTRGKR